MREEFKERNVKTGKANAQSDCKIKYEQPVLVKLGDRNRDTSSGFEPAGDCTIYGGSANY